LLKVSLNSYAAKDTICVLFLTKKDPKLSSSELLFRMTRIQSESSSANNKKRKYGTLGVLALR
jgi:hypothetical protein